MTSTVIKEFWKVLSKFGTHVSTWLHKPLSDKASHQDQYNLKEKDNVWLFFFFLLQFKVWIQDFFKAVLRKQWINYKRKFLFVCSLQRAGRHTRFDPCTDGEILFKKGTRTSRLTSKRFTHVFCLQWVNSQKELARISFFQGGKKKSTDVLVRWAEVHTGAEENFWHYVY